MSSYSFLIPESSRPSPYFLSFLFTKILSSNTGLVNSDFGRMFDITRSKNPTPLPVQMNMGTEESKAGGKLTFEGTKRKR